MSGLLVIALWVAVFAVGLPAIAYYLEWRSQR